MNLRERNPGRDKLVGCRLFGIWRDERGNFAILTALLLPLLLFIAGNAIDATRTLMIRGLALSAADAATLAAAAQLAGGEIDASEARDLARKFYVSQLTQDSGLPAETLAHLDSEIIVDYDHEAGVRTAKVQLTSHGEVDPAFPIRFLDGALFSWSIDSVAQSSSQTHNAISMYLVLDKSGSMDEPAGDAGQTGNPPGGRGGILCIIFPSLCSGGESKMDALKQAVTSLTSTLADADPDHEYVRMGAIAFDSEADTKDKVDLAWGTTQVENYVQSLVARGNTDSSEAVDEAYYALRGNRERAEHRRVNEQEEPARIMVLMSDGENNHESDSLYTEDRCKDAKEHGIRVFSVAFMAPPRGERMLERCASGEDHYFTAKNASELVKAFQTIGARASDLSVRLTE